MTKPVVITCDSTCDLSPELCERYDIRVIPLTILLGDDSYLDGVGFGTQDIYARYRADGTLPKTSAPGIQQFTDFFTAILDEGCEIVHLDISAELSSSFNNACIAASELEGVYPVDSRMLCNGVGLLAIEGAECRDKGMSAAEIAEHLHLLRLKPALEMKDGKLSVYKKYRGAMSSVYRQYVRERLASADVRPGHVFLADSGEVPEETLRELKDMILEAVPEAVIHDAKAGCTIVSHCGPKTLGVMFIRK